MNEDIITTVAKRTFKEIVDQVKDTPNVVMPFAVVGLVFGDIYATIVCCILIIALVAYDEYKELISEIENDVKAASFEAAQTVTPAEPVAQAQAEPTVVVVEETEKK